MHRRTLLGMAAVSGLAGCLSSDGTRADHPATRSLAGNPWLGVEPGNASRLIVGFEDPSCGTCRRFHEETLPTLRRDLIGPTTSFVYRPFPIIAPWGQPASHAVLATMERDREAAWSLIAFYYEEQGAFFQGDVTTLTADHLESIDVDPQPIVEAIEAESFHDQIQTSLTAGQDATVGSTPTFFLFRDDEFVTELSGVQDPSVFTSALES